MLSDIIILLVMILLNGYFSLAEMAIVSARRQRLQALMSARKRTDGATGGYEAAIALHADPGRFLSAQQIGITLVGVFSGAFGGATLSEPLAQAIAPVPYIGPYAEQISLGLVVIVITYLSLILGELVPKRLALSNPEAIAATIARPMTRLAKVLGPAVDLLSLSTEAVLKLYGITGQQAVRVTEEEIKHLVEEGAAAGAIEGVERDIVNRVFRLGDTRVTEIMTPRLQMVWLDTGFSVEENLALIRSEQKMRYPIRRGASGGPIGMIRLEDIFMTPKTNEEMLRRMSPPIYIPRTASVLKALSILQSESMFMAFIIDEYGDVVGSLTMGEIFFAMIGDLTEHATDSNPAVTMRDDGSYVIDGVVSVDEVRRLLKLNKLPGDEQTEVNTLAGVMFNWFGRLPRAGDYFGWNGYRFEVGDMDGRKIDKLLVSRLARLSHGDGPAEG
jgi:putative hemolysin